MKESSALSFHTWGRNTTSPRPGEGKGLPHVTQAANGRAGMLLSRGSCPITVLCVARWGGQALRCITSVGDHQGN